MKNANLNLSRAALAMLAGAAVLAPHTAQAHCDGLDGPVVKAAQKALSESNINLVLIWVQKEDETEIRRAFEKTLAVRKLNAERPSWPTGISRNARARSSSERRRALHRPQTCRPRSGPAILPATRHWRLATSSPL
jgi:Family of unknown function (DUF6448)